MTRNDNDVASKLRVAVLGCSGSIGTQTLDVCRQHADKLQVVALSVNSSTAFLAQVAREFGAAHVAVASEEHRHDAALADLPEGCELSFGEEAVAALAELPDVDVVIVALVGAIGVWSCERALRAGKRVGLANKESLVIAGDLIMPLAARSGELIPVDSEHSAIFQCYRGEKADQAHAIWLTCSGGPFFGRSRAELAAVTREDALAHPTWQMGAKITVDSATLMNKGLECIEAHHLFGVDMDLINVLIQRESKIHSMVEYADGSVIAHLGASDMRIPIQYAFSCPDRWDTPCPRVDFRTLGALTFAAPDTEAFRCLALALEAGRAGGTLPCVLNAANEVAVAAFLSGSCSFTDIDAAVEHAMDHHDRMRVESLEQLWDIDRTARTETARFLQARS